MVERGSQFRVRLAWAERVERLEKEPGRHGPAQPAHFRPCLNRQGACGGAPRPAIREERIEDRLGLSLPFHLDQDRGQGQLYVRGDVTLGERGRLLQQRDRVGAATQGGQRLPAQQVAGDQLGGLALDALQFVQRGERSRRQVAVQRRPCSKERQRHPVVAPPRRQLRGQRGNRRPIRTRGRSSRGPQRRTDTTHAANAD